MRRNATISSVFDHMIYYDQKLCGSFRMYMCMYILRISRKMCKKTHYKYPELCSEMFFCCILSKQVNQTQLHMVCGFNVAVHGCDDERIVAHTTLLQLYVQYKQISIGVISLLLYCSNTHSLLDYPNNTLNVAMYRNKKRAMNHESMHTNVILPIRHRYKIGLRIVNK